MAFFAHAAATFELLLPRKKSGRENLPLLLSRDDWKGGKGKLSDRQAIGVLFVDGPWL